ncbi:IclR family transcriptional regulator [Pusillimonas sp. ANT_WB101]|uniref:IclR family transcriptional regulator n=1 Tax=Pusillimonas sp. ANT_WB101 TaxID=2597356 RepID=UPI0011ED3AD3|nr:IclR family transcriptional regulator [Pusillimonas sp. ANT_WB101]KAA0911160.1 IclR family transcriptional regulator [Pusillimonas sp. ANT_WB101]
MELPSAALQATRPSGSQAIQRAILVLRSIARSHENGIGLSVLCQHTKLNKSTVHRITATLISEGLVEQHEQTRRYYLGTECYTLGLIAADRFRLRNVVDEPVRRLARETGDAAFFSVRQGTHALCLLREDGNYPLKSHVLHAGDRHPLGVGGGSLAMLSAMDDKWVNDYLDRSIEDIGSLYPVYTRDVLESVVQESRSRGYAVNRGLVLKGSWGVGVAIRDPDGQVMGAYSIATVESRMSAEREAVLYRLLRTETNALEKYLQDSHKNVKHTDFSS